MRALRPLLLAATLLAPVQALALADPSPSAKDARIRVEPYDPMQVARLVSTGRVPLQIIFEDGEKPLLIAGSAVFTDPAKAGDGWYAHPSGSVLILEPQKDVPTILFVRTAAADGKERHYTFELRTQSGSVVDGTGYTTVQFTYRAPPDPDAAAAARARQEAARAAAEARVVDARLSAPAAAAWNIAYWMRDPAGCPVLAPIRAYDDGHRTTLEFPPHATLPEVYVLNQDGKEAITTPMTITTPVGLRVVIPSVQRIVRLRRGGKVCELRNDGFDPVGTQPGGGTGTTSPDVLRQARAP